MTDQYQAYYRKRLTEEHLKLLLSDNAIEADRHRIKASFYERKLEELGEKYDPVRRQFERVGALSDV